MERRRRYGAAVSPDPIRVQSRGLWQGIALPVDAEHGFPYWVMAWGKPGWAPAPVELSIGVVGHLLAWEKVEADST